MKALVAAFLAVLLALLPSVAHGQAKSPSSSGGVTPTAVGSSPNANACTVTGSLFTLQPADGSNPGVVTSGAQTIGGAKTFSALVTATSGVKIGASGTAKTKDFTCTVNFNFASINAATCSSTTITCTGAAAGDAVAPRWPVSGLNNGLVGIMWVTAADTVTVRLCNVTGAGIDPAALDFGARVSD
jgi:hypothetical protein